MLTVQMVWLLSCSLAIKFIESSLVRDNSTVRSPDDEGGTAMNKDAFPRILDFHILGLYEKTGNGSQSLSMPGLRVVSGVFSLYVLHAGRMLPVSQQVYIDHYTTELNKGQSLHTLDSMIVLKNEKLPNPTKSYICYMRIRMGIQTCQLPQVCPRQMCSGHFIRVKIAERIRLVNCQQSGIGNKSQSNNCERAYAMVAQQITGLAGCSLTNTELRPWWRAEAPSSYLFDKLDIYAAANLNRWTGNFDVLIEETRCVRVKNGTPFTKKTFTCGLHGKRIRVQETGAKPELMALCEIVAYGVPGGCYDIRKRETRCSRGLPGHIGQGIVPYPAGLNCEWVMAPERRSVALLLQFPDFATAGPQDYVAIFEGAGTRGRRLAVFYGNDSGGQLPPKYEKSGIYGARQYILSGNITNVVTVQFVTARDGSGSVRGVQTHRGFRMSYMAISEDNMYEPRKQSVFHRKRRVCPVDRYAEILWSTCATRGGVNPVHVYGAETGGQMLTAMEKSKGNVTTLPVINVALMQVKLGYVPFKMPEFEFDLTAHQVSVMCGAYMQPEVPPRYFAECCCKHCSRRELSKYCLWTYGEPEDCAVDIRRVESVRKVEKIIINAWGLAASD